MENQLLITQIENGVDEEITDDDVIESDEEERSNQIFNVREAVPP